MGPGYAELVLQSHVFGRYCNFILPLELLQKYFLVTHIKGLMKNSSQS